MKFDLLKVSKVLYSNSLCGLKILSQKFLVNLSSQAGLQKTEALKYFSDKFSNKVFIMNTETSDTFKDPSDLSAFSNSKAR